MQQAAPRRPSCAALNNLMTWLAASSPCCCLHRGRPFEFLRLRQLGKEIHDLPRGWLWLGLQGVGGACRCWAGRGEGGGPNNGTSDTGVDRTARRGRQQGRRQAPRDTHREDWLSRPAAPRRWPALHREKGGERAEAGMTSLVNLLRGPRRCRWCCCWWPRPPPPWCNIDAVYKL